MCSLSVYTRISALYALVPLQDMTIKLIDLGEAAVDLDVSSFSGWRNVGTTNYKAGSRAVPGRHDECCS